MNKNILDRENFFKIIVIFLLLAIGCLIFYYTNIVEKEKNREWQVKCEKYGIEKYGNALQSEGDIQTDRHYYFSKNLNSCVMYLEYYNYKTKYRSYSLINMYTEKELFSYYTECEYTNREAGKSDDEIRKECSSMAEFNKRKDEIIK